MWPFHSATANEGLSLTSCEVPEEIEPLEEIIPPLLSDVLAEEVGVDPVIVPDVSEEIDLELCKEELLELVSLGFEWEQTILLSIVSLGLEDGAGHSSVSSDCCVVRDVRELDFEGISLDEYLSLLDAVLTSIGEELSVLLL